MEKIQGVSPKNIKIVNQTDFYQLTQGKNKIRLISLLYPMGQHYVPAEKKSHICIGKDNGCKYCEAGIKMNLKHLCYVIDRDNGDIKKFQMPYTVVKALHEFADSEDYAFDEMPNYDITISKKGEKLNTEYTVIPAKESNLTEEEFEKVNALDDLGEILTKWKEKEMGNVATIPSSEEIKEDIPVINEDEEEIDLSDLDV